MKLQLLQSNPKNPRIIKDRAFFKLVDNLLRYSKFLEKRPIVHHDFVVQGGNMRLKGLEYIIKLSKSDFAKLAEQNGLSEELIQLWNGIRKSKEIPDAWVADAKDFSEEELKAFTIIDNVNAGEWDMDALANDWESAALAGWGLEYPASFGSADSGNDDDMPPSANGTGRGLPFGQPERHSQIRYRHQRRLVRRLDSGITVLS